MNSFSHTATAHVATERPGRYGKQLVSHMSRKITGEWDEEKENGTLIFDREGQATGRVQLSTREGFLTLELFALPDHAERLEYVVGIHLARFGARDGLRIAWERADGSAGSVQGPLTPEEVAEHMRAKREAATSSSAERYSSEQK